MNEQEKPIIDPPPGLIANGANVVPLTYFRVYSATPASAGVGPTVFGVTLGEVGGSYVGSTTEAFSACQDCLDLP